MLRGRLKYGDPQLIYGRTQTRTTSSTRFEGRAEGRRTHRGWCVSLRLGGRCGWLHSDTGCFCGIAGHKPTGGLVPTTGHYPPASGRPGVSHCGSYGENRRRFTLVDGNFAGADARSPVPAGLTRLMRRKHRRHHGSDITAKHQWKLRAAIEDAARRLEQRGPPLSITFRRPGKRV